MTQPPSGHDEIFRFANEGIIVVDERGKIVRINPSAEKMFGYENGELKGASIEQLVPKRFAAAHRNHRKNFNKNAYARSMGKGNHLLGQRKDKSEFPVEISLSPYSTPQGQFTIAFIIDISLRLQAEEKIKNYSYELENQVKKRTLILEEAIQQLEKTKSELNHALEKERELNELKSRFVSMASHEFRTPLATILSSVALIGKYAERGETDKQHKHILKIKSSINDLTDILNDFLSLSKLEEGKVESFSEDFELKDFLESVVREMEPLVKEGQSLNYHHSGKTKAHLDRRLLKNILFNLVSNAIKFSPEGKPIDITSSHNSSGISISVKDRGIGISKSDQKHLFERFFRGHNAMNIQGTGLGLNIVMKYAELMNGSVNFTSIENKGTTFTLTFPQ